jgi:hypothetical protein
METAVIMAVIDTLATVFIAIGVCKLSLSKK